MTTPLNRPLSRSKLLVTALVTLTLSGCASFSADGGFKRVEGEAQSRLGANVQVPRPADSAATTQVRALLAKPISADDAVQIALLNNPGLKVSLAELQIAEADLVQAGRLRNPGFYFARLKRGTEIELERTFTLDILGLFAIPLKTEIESRRFEQAQLGAAGDVLKLAAETRRAYFSAVAAQESLAYLEQVKIAAETSAELARRMAQVGNWSKLAQMREQLFYAESTSQLARAKQTVIAERERLTRLMGLWGSDLGFKLPERLPVLPAKPIERTEVEATALQNRLDLQMAKQEVAGMAQSIGLSKATRFVNVLDLGYQHNTSNEAPRQTGYEIDIQIPIFDWGDAKVARAEAAYRQAVNRTAETAINARSEAREAYQSYRTAFDLAQHYRDEIVPLRKKISDEQLLRYNGMLISVFELIADAREQVMSVNGYIESLRDYWLAETDLQGALSGPGSGSNRTLAQPAASGDRN
ncbi:MAG: TolC family protein [Burkholderiales bacterium]|nr:TolC family protein [Burkholderiales bacterium]